MISSFFGVGNLSYEIPARFSFTFYGDRSYTATTNLKFEFIALARL